MLRIFFGYMYSCDVASDWIDACGFDHTFHMFLEGSQNTVDSTTYNVHKRIPQAVGYTGIDKWLEYVDLMAASIDATPNEMTREFTDLAGVSDFVQFETDDGLSHGSYLSGGIVNKLVIESWPEEFLKTTVRRDLPVPDITRANTPKLYAENKTLGADPSLSIIGYRAFAVTIDPSSPALLESYASPEVIVPIHAETDDIMLCIKSDTAYTTAVVNLFRATVTIRYEDTKPIYAHSDFMRKITGSIYSGSISAGWQPCYAVDPYTQEYANETSFAYAAKAVAAFCPFEPNNPLIPRIACDFFNRNRSGLGVRWLILNTSTHKYYECILLNVSPLFIEGYDKVSDKSAQITLGVMDEGSFVDAALSDPEETDYFFSIKRDYTDAS